MIGRFCSSSKTLGPRGFVAFFRPLQSSDAMRGCPGRPTEEVHREQRKSLLRQDLEFLAVGVGMQSLMLIDGWVKRNVKIDFDWYLFRG